MTRLLDALESVPWRAVEHAADLGGTGRTGSGCGPGVPCLTASMTPEMRRSPAPARSTITRQADVGATGLASGEYDLVTTCLVEEHLRDLRPLYREASRLLRPSGCYVLVGYHLTSS